MRAFIISRRGWTSAGMLTALLVALLCAVSLAVVSGAAAEVVPRDPLWVEQWNEPSFGRIGDVDVSATRTGGVFVGLEIRSRTEGGASFRGYELLLRKYASSGAVVWSRRVGARAAGDLSLLGVVTDASGNALLVGSSPGSSTGDDWLVRKYSSGGTLRWSRRIDGTKHGDDAPVDFAVDRYGNVVVTGTRLAASSTRDWVTIKFSPAGKALWTSTRAGWPRGLAVEPSGRIYLAGGWGGTDRSYSSIVCLGSSGAKLWTKSIVNNDGWGVADVATNGRRVCAIVDVGRDTVATTLHGQTLLVYSRTGASRQTLALDLLGASSTARCGIDVDSGVVVTGPAKDSASEGVPDFVVYTVPTAGLAMATADRGFVDDLAVTPEGTAFMAGGVRVFNDLTVAAWGIDAAGGGWKATYAGETLPLNEACQAVAVTGDAVYVAGAESFPDERRDLLLLKIAR
jgi:hypothetical protein